MSRAWVVVIPLFAALVGPLGGVAEAHRSGCHRWHSCPSDSGSYVCGDLGYPCEYPTYPESGGSSTDYYDPPTDDESYEDESYYDEDESYEDESYEDESYEDESYEDDDASSGEDRSLLAVLFAPGLLLLFFGAMAWEWVAARVKGRRR